MEKFVKIEMDVIEISREQLEEYDNDIGCLIDVEFDCDWMEYEDGYILLDCCSGNPHFLVVK